MKNKQTGEETKPNPSLHTHFCSVAFLDGGNAAFRRSSSVKVPRPAKGHPVVATLEKHFEDAANGVLKGMF